MDIVTLHPLDLDVVSRYIASLRGSDIDDSWRSWYGEQLRGDLGLVARGDEAAANRITLGLARALGQREPIFLHQPFGLSFWEAHVDRPIGMLMRPPSRLFQDAGLEARAVRAMPIRLDFQHGMMGGAYIPDRLIEQAIALLDDHLERVVKRMIDAEYDAVGTYGLMYEALDHARQHGVGLFEASDVVGPEGQGLPGARILTADATRLDSDLHQRLIDASKPPKKPGLFARILGRGASPSSNGRHPHA